MSTLDECRGTLHPGGRLIFEARDPSKGSWKTWNRSQSYQVIDAPGLGKVEMWVDLIDVQLPLVSFRHTFVFQREGTVQTSDSTLKFRSKSEILESLYAANLSVDDIRDAPDRPGLEFVFIARRHD
jgi:hypothetical protein